MKRKGNRGSRYLVSICLLVALLMLVGICASAADTAPQTYTSGDWSYQLVDGGAVITGCRVLEAVLFIPGQLDGHQVTGIGDYALVDCASLTNVTIPDSVTSIGFLPFARWSVTFINVSDQHPVFTQMDGVLFSKDKRELVAYPIARKGAYVIPGGTTCIGDRAFWGCGNLTGITIPPSVTGIGFDAFGFCDNLTSISLPSSVTSIGDNAFDQCKNLTSVTMPLNLSHIGKGVFTGCYELVDITIPAAVTSIGKQSFSFCTQLANLNIPTSVTSIGMEAFFHCRSLASISIPPSVTSIGENAFKGCSEKFRVLVEANSYAAQYASEQNIAHDIASDGYFQAVCEEEEALLQRARATEETLQNLAVAAQSNPQALQPVCDTVGILLEAERLDEARAFLAQKLLEQPLRAELHLLDARVQLLAGDVGAAQRAMMTARVAAGNDAVLAVLLHEELAAVVLALADDFARQKRYAEAGELYALCAPVGGENVLYLQTMARLNGEPPPVSAHPGISAEAFNAALAEDRLALVPADIGLSVNAVAFYRETVRYGEALRKHDSDAKLPFDEVISEEELNAYRDETIEVSGDAFRKSLDIGSLSPDGNHALYVLDDSIPVVANLETSEMRFIAPGVDFEQDQAVVMGGLDKALILRTGMTWSPWGDRLVITYRTLRVFGNNFSMNALLLDANRGMVHTVVPGMPFFSDLSVTSEPTRAAFDATGQSLYYDVSRAAGNADVTHNEIRARDLATGEEHVAAQYDHSMVGDDPALWVDGRGIWHTYSDTQAGEYGILQHISPDVRIYHPSVHKSGRLLDVCGDMGLYFSALATPETEEEEQGASIANVLVPFPLDNVPTDGFTRTLAVRPDAAPGDRLAWIDLSQYPVLQDDVADALQSSELLIPYNAALSPDGRCALLIAKDASGMPCAYICDMYTGTCGLVDISGLALSEREAADFCKYTAENTNIRRGIAWRGNNRLLLNITGKGTIVELVLR